LARNGWKKGFVFFLVAAIVLFGVSKTTGFDRLELSFAEKLYKDTLAPLQGGVMNVSQKVSSYFRTLVELKQLKARNKALEKEVGSLQGQLVEFDNLRAENLRFKGLLNFKDQSLDKFRLEAAIVIGRTPDNWFNTITVNKGENDGIEKNMAVISPKGLVGHVTSVSNNSADILLILDPRSGVAALLRDLRAHGAIEGLSNENNKVKMIYIPEDAKLKEGETVVTSGLGGIFPKGLAIGRVESFEKESGGLTQRAVVRTFVDFNFLEEVFIIKQSWVEEE